MRSMKMYKLNNSLQKQIKQVSKILATNITYLRHQKKWSQEELADKCGGRTAKMISNLENAKVIPKLDVVIAISLALNCSISYLIEDHGFVVSKKRVDSK